MADNLKLARLYFVLLAIFALGRWVQSLKHVEYDKAHQVFSIVTLTFLAAFFYGAFGRRWRGLSLGQAALLGLMLGFSSQIVIFLSTLASYSLGLETFFNNPRALNSPVPLDMAAAMQRRAGGLVVGPIFDAIAAALGWALGALLPPKN